MKSSLRYALALGLAVVSIQSFSMLSADAVMMDDGDQELARLESLLAEIKQEESRATRQTSMRSDDGGSRSVRRYARQRNRPYQEPKVSADTQKKEMRRSERTDAWMSQRAMYRGLHTQFIDDLKQDREDGDYDYRYRVPALPLHAQPFEGRSSFQSETSFKFGQEAFLDNSDIVSLPSLAFGKEYVKLRDIFGELDLVKKGQVTTGANDPVYKLLADTAVEYRGTELGINKVFSWRKHVSKNRVTIGFELPLTCILRDLRVQPVIDTAFWNAANYTLFDTVASKNGYARTVEQLLANVLKRGRGIDTKNIMKVWGSEGVRFFVCQQFTNTKLEYANAGISLNMYPHINDADIDNVWAPNLLKPSIGSLTLFATAAMHHSYMSNPYVYAAVTVLAPRRMKVRVPALFALNSTGVLQNTSFDIETFTATTGNTNLKAYNTSIPAFSEDQIEVSFAAGPELHTILGNTFDRVFIEQGSVSAYYDAKMKMGDLVSELTVPEESWNPNKGDMDKSPSFAHKFGVEYRYQRDIRCSMNIGGTMTLYGVRVPRTFEAHINFNYVW